VIASQQLRHDERNGTATTFVTLADLVELIEAITGYDVNGLHDLSPGALRFNLEAPLTAVVKLPGGATFEGFVDRLTLKISNRTTDDTDDAREDTTDA
jgi:hypothetical protein